MSKLSPTTMKSELNNTDVRPSENLQTSDNGDIRLQQVQQQDLLMNIIHQEWSVVKTSLDSKELLDEVRVEGIINPTPLHVVSSIAAVPLYIVMSILYVYGNSCCVIADDDEKLPIHIACATVPLISPKVIQALLRAYPETSFMKEGGDGELPLHLLLKQSNGPELLYQMLETLPKNCIVDSERGTSLVHESCSSLLPECALRKILHLYPEIAFSSNHANGETIAHVICSHKDSTPSMVQLLLSQNPRLVAVRDGYGNLPLHIVNSNLYSEQIIQLLLTAYPESILELNGQMQTPLSARLICTSPNKVRAMLQYSSPLLKRALLRTRNAAGFLPVEIIFHQIQSHLSYICNSLQTKITPALLSRLQRNSSRLMNMVESFSIIMANFYSDVTINNNKLPQEKIEESPDVSFDDGSSYWLSLPLFTALLLWQYPDIVFHEDSRGDLPLHIVASATVIFYPSLCEDFFDDLGHNSTDVESRPRHTLKR